MSVGDDRNDGSLSACVGVCSDNTTATVDSAATTTTMTKSRVILPLLVIFCIAMTSFRDVTAAAGIFLLKSACDSLAYQFRYLH